MIPRTAHRAGTRGLHRASPVGNILVLSGFLVAVLASPGISVKIGALVLVLGLAVLSGENLGTFLRNIRFVVVFALVLLIAQALSNREGTTLFSLGVPITDQGLLAGGQMALRFLVILTSSFLFVLVTDPDRLAHTLIRLGIPYRYGFIFILALRFVPFFRRELHTVREAQRVRGIKTSVKNLAGLQRAIRYTFVPVLVSGLMRVDSIAMSMKGRCFGLHPRRTSTRRECWGGADWAAAALFAGLVGVALFSRGQAWL